MCVSRAIYARLDASVHTTRGCMRVERAPKMFERKSSVNNLLLAQHNAVNLQRVKTGWAT